MLRSFLLTLLLFMIKPATAQDTLPVVIVKRIQVADAGINKKQSFYYRRKEEFHQVLVRDLGERTGKKAPVSFYVDFLAEKEKTKGEYFVEVRWLNLRFYNGETQVRSKPTGNVRRYTTGSASETTTNTIEQVQNEYKYIYPVEAALELLIYKKVNNELQLVYEHNQPATYQYETVPKNTASINYRAGVPKAPEPDKPLIFKELNLSYYDFIKNAILDFFNHLQ